MKRTILFLTALCCGMAFAQKKIQPVSITASSTLTDSKNAARYSVNNLMDGKNDSWVEGDKGDGLGAYVSFDFGQKVELTQIVIRNGYGDLKYWEQNNRVKDLLLSFDGMGGVCVHLYDNPGYQLIQFKSPEQVKKLTMSIESVYKGSKYDDTAIAEVSFNDWNCYSEGLKYGQDEKDLERSICDTYINKIADFYTAFAKKKYNYTGYRSASHNEEGTGHDDFTVMKPVVSPVRDGSIVVSWSMPESNVTGKSGDGVFVLYTKITGSSINIDQKLFPCYLNDDDVKDYESRMKKGDKNSEAFLKRLTKLNEDMKTAKKQNEPYLLDDYNAESLFSYFDLDVYGKTADPVMKKFLTAISIGYSEDRSLEYMPEYFYTYEVGWR